MTTTTTSTAAETTSAPTPEPRTPLWEDFVDIYYAPSQVFARRRDDPRFGVALALLAVVMTLLFFASQTVLADVYAAEFERGMREAMAENPGMSAEQMEGARAMAGIFGTVGFAIAFPIGVLLVGVVLWAVGKAMGAAVTVAAAVMIATYAQFPRVLQMLVTVAQGLVLDMSEMSSVFDVSLSPARFLDADAATPLTLALLGRLDLFVLWSTLLLAIGLHAAGRLPRARAYAAAVVVWLLATLPQVVGSLVGG